MGARKGEKQQDGTRLGSGDSAQLVGLSAPRLLNTTQNFTKLFFYETKTFLETFCLALRGQGTRPVLTTESANVLSQTFPSSPRCTFALNCTIQRHV